MMVARCRQLVSKKINLDSGKLAIVRTLENNLMPLEDILSSSSIKCKKIVENASID